ncbi:MAG: Gfo/Idh/MocA family oxidoreductase, partial [Oscillospiraceae bacterium]|nr:Gfo/Idh/MocA family oxidoreductase [Oscillospiraceae bacterium]
MEAMWARLVPGTIQTMKLIEDGLLGEVRGVEGKFCYTLDADEMDHHVLKAANGGGSLLDVGVYGLSFASWYLGKAVRKIQASADLYHGIDAHACVLMQYDNGAIADLSSAVLLRKPNEGYIYGTKGYVHLNRFYAPQNIEVNLLNGEQYSIPTPYRGNGFEEQIAHVCDCIAQGLTESPVVTQEQTLYIARQMDAIRRQIGVLYPQDDE